VVAVSRSKQALKQSDLTTAIKGVRKAGVQLERIKRIEIERDGRIVIVIADGKAPEEGRELDDWLKKHARPT
jgi:hypothetical protein